MTAPKVGFVSLGCPKALVDSERILTQLRTDGYQIEASYAGADEDEIRELHPAVLSVTGPQQYEQVVSAVHRHAPFSRDHDPYTDLVPPQGIKLTPRHYAYLKISEGCNHRCTFCIIPSMRGKLASRPAGDVLAEAEGLVDAGVKELLVISQDTSAYGVDLKYKLDFWGGKPVKTRMTELCQALGSLGVWVRLHYVYPYPHVDELIPLMADGIVLPYLDIPLQHGSPRILKLMKRPAAAENALERIRRWREICPDITLRSTFIIGFPGETDADFQQLLEFIVTAQLDRVGCFQYSPVEGARANDLPDHVPADVMAEREEAFMALQADISSARLQAKVGQTVTALVDASDEHGAIARSAADAPEIDGQVYISNGQHLQPGDMVEVQIESADQHDLYGSHCS
jgi:ribosomal protein S12 methylthiotransferase